MESYSAISTHDTGPIAEGPDQKSLDNPQAFNPAPWDAHFMSTLVDVTKEGWLLCDFSGNVLDACITKLTDHSIQKEDFAGLNIFEFLDEDLREKSLQFLAKVKQEGKASGIEHVKLFDGEERSYQYKDVVVYENGEAVAVKIFVWDITDMVRDKHTLEASEARYRGVFENTGLPIVILEENLLISMVNLKFEALSGYEKHEIEEKMSLVQFIEGAPQASVQALFSGTAGEFPLEYECRLRNRASELFDMIIRFNKIANTGQMIATFIDITAQKLTETDLLESRNHLQKEVSVLRSSLKERYRFGDIIGKSRVMQEVYETIIMAANAKANVIIYGESGTGKELAARAIHQMSSREQDRFVTVNCGAIPENIIESEFFGYKKGAFTGAFADKPGYLDSADGGTLFLDEIGELNLNMQAKLLRVIDGGGFIPLGSNKIRKTDVRIVAATNRNLQDLVREKTFREDFFYRIHIITINLPPLRERKEDIPLLIEHFIELHGGVYKQVPGKMVDQFLTYDWPGNVRELQNAVQRYLSMKKIDFESPVSTKHGCGQPWKRSEERGELKELLDVYEKEIIETTLHQLNWRRSEAAAALGINRRTLFDKMSKYGLQRPQDGTK